MASDVMTNPLEEKLKKYKDEVDEYKEKVKKASSFNIQKHIVSLLIGDKAEPFFAFWSRKTTKIATMQIPTAGVSAKDGELVLYYNPVFMSDLTNDEIRGILKHEFYHLIFGHLTTRKKEPHKIWNLATDCAINSLIPMHELPKCGIIPGEFCSDKNEDEIINPLTQLIKKLPKEKSSEWYYDVISNDDEVVDYIENSDCEEQFDNHEWGDDLTDDEKDILKEKIKSMLNDAIDEADSSNRWGSISHSIRETLRELASRQVDWKKVLQQVFGMAVSTKKSSSIKTINKRYPYIHPGRKKTRQAKIRVYIDQSSSVKNEDIELFFGELKNLSRKTDFECFFFDHKVDEENKFLWRKNQKAPTLRTRCGGTNFDAVVEHFNKDIRAGLTDASMIAILTDGECSIPRPCIKKLAYIVCPDRKLYFSPRENEIVIQMRGRIN